MELQDTNVQTLIDLGLTPSEARVYLALHGRETAKATEISKVSMVPRPDVYRALSRLLTLGLVEKIITRPFRFRNTPIETGLATLLELKSNECDELKSKTGSLLLRLNNKHIRKDSHHQDSGFVLVPNREVLIQRLRKAIDNAQKSIDISTSSKRFKTACHRLNDILENAWLRGVKGRVVMEKAEESVLDAVKAVWKSPSAEIRCVPTIPKTIMVMYDKKELFICIDPKANLFDSPALWSNNINLLGMAEYSFDALWKTAKKS